MADEKKPKGEQQAKPKPEKAERADKGGAGKGGGKGDKRRGADGGGAVAQAVVSSAEAVAPRLHEKYKGEVIPALTKQFNYKNANQVPRLQKIVVNMGLGAAVANPKIIDTAVEELRAIAGQKPIVTRSKKAIANFKLRAGLPIGAMITLRRSRMWEFLDRLVSVALPRTRDFKGVSRKAFDGKGNYTLGLREQIIFPEINYDKIDAIKGLNISFVTTARTDEEGRALLQQLGMPFRAN
ncbi:MAG: 50S ribosomal protein L5 [Polyangiaceae bacterium]|jgi:large subunit ribosomal protein L5